jgi:hypothetical protein
MPTRYDRFLDMHLVAPWRNSTKAQMGVGLGDYYSHSYDFKGDVRSQRRAYKRKYGLTARNAKVLDYVLGQNHVDANMQSGLAGHALDTMRYIGCYVDIDSVRQKERLIPDLEALVKWVSAETDDAGNPMKGKLRLNCHGDSTQNSGLYMGNSPLHPMKWSMHSFGTGLPEKVCPMGMRRVARCRTSSSASRILRFGRPMRW